MREKMHILVGIAFWIAFAGMWSLLILQQKATPAGATSSLLELLIIATGVMVITLAWVSHNLRIYRRKGQRRGTPVYQPNVHKDTLGRNVRWDFPSGHEDAVKVGHIVVSMSKHEKRYHPPVESGL